MEEKQKSMKFLTGTDPVLTEAVRKQLWICCASCRRSVDIFRKASSRRLPRRPGSAFPL